MNIHLLAFVVSIISLLISLWALRRAIAQRREVLARIAHPAIPCVGCDAPSVPVVTCPYCRKTGCDCGSPPMCAQCQEDEAEEASYGG